MDLYMYPPLACVLSHLNSLYIIKPRFFQINFNKKFLSQILYIQSEAISITVWYSSLII